MLCPGQEAEQNEKCRCLRGLSLVGSSLIPTHLERARISEGGGEDGSRGEMDSLCCECHDFPEFQREGV